MLNNKVNNNQNSTSAEILLPLQLTEISLHEINKKIKVKKITSQ
jgi:hypothetical protein